MAEYNKIGNSDRARITFCCPACGTEFTELPKNLEAEHIDRLGSDIVFDAYLFQTECPICGLPLRQMKIFDNAAPEEPGT